jgi:hypothetical protein
MINFNYMMMMIMMNEKNNCLWENEKEFWKGVAIPEKEQGSYRN